MNPTPINGIRRIPWYEFANLRHCGELMNVKVTSEITDGDVYVRFQRVRTKDLDVAQRELQNIAQTLVYPRDEREVAS